MNQPDAPATLLDSNTLDPKITTARASSGAHTALPCLDVAFHPDLRRVGDSLWLTCGGGDEPPAVIGRSAPDFHGEANAAALGDPCISRSQIKVRYCKDQGAFALERADDSRRSLEVFDMDGTSLGPLSASLRLVSPGCYLAIGDRILLRLSLRVPSPSTLGMIGISDGIAGVRRMVEVLAGMPGTVLVTGETGAGKELVALAIHQKRHGSTAPFVAVNCSAIPESLADAELFGHAGNAFTGARAKRPGLLRAAEGGTAFLDEVGELSLSIQAKLLRVVQERAVRPVGSDTDVPFSARLVFATHRDLARMVASGDFREDLYRRIETPHIEVPSLRERPEDVPMLFARFLCAHPRAVALGLVKGASDERAPVPMQHVRSLISQRWPGNVRLLHHHVEQLVFQTALHGRFSAPTQSFSTPPNREPTSAPPDDEMRHRVRKALKDNEYNHALAAQALGVARSTLNRWMAAFGIRTGASLKDSEIRAALAANTTIRDAARELSVSERALRLRMTELRIAP